MAIFVTPSFVLHALSTARRAASWHGSCAAAARNFALLTLEFIVPTIESNLFIMINRTKPMWWKNFSAASKRSSSFAQSFSFAVGQCVSLS
jgi:hypothetical protein